MITFFRLSRGTDYYEAFISDKTGFTLLNKHGNAIVKSTINLPVPKRIELLKRCFPGYKLSMGYCALMIVLLICLSGPVQARPLCQVELPAPESQISQPGAIGFRYDIQTGAIQYVDPRSDMFPIALPGDLILSINGESVIGRPSFSFTRPVGSTGVVSFRHNFGNGGYEIVNQAVVYHPLGTFNLPNLARGTRP